ncbi:peroxiredoxin Q/BCP [Panacagrimonas perspica]|uniref:thioredoxin-dependent peroxiredoxin n=1 Tax=Panacagrimonas perspica TaxID=381431 RepID=A0A4S3JZC9_9GAMM|nr:peroxiredoxin [Panacagrimonas perspica]TDU32850.1 peroxiredoxin Q/BCP [Panacagrimonas perspica]THD00963.1 peroxiredoxin [Panacagrimonas perspica]
MTLSVGDKIPDLSLPANGGRTVGFKDYKGKKLVVYFYPKDNTPGCTQEGQDYRDLYKQYVKAGADIVGISKDSVKSHDNFVAKFEFPFTLLADTEGAACDAFGAIVEKSMYGRKYMGIDRCTWLFDEKGKLRQVWRGVKVKGHAAEVLEAVKAL